jgi:hypothetical protein
MGGLAVSHTTTDYIPFAEMRCIYVPAAVCRRRDLRAGDKLLYGFLTTSRYSIPELASIMQRTPQTIRRRIRKLQRVGLLRDFHE